MLKLKKFHIDLSRSWTYNGRLDEQTRQDGDA